MSESASGALTGCTFLTLLVSSPLWAGSVAGPVVRPELAVVFDSGREEFERLVLGAVGKSGHGT